MTQFSKEFCEYSLLKNGDDLEAAHHWLSERLNDAEYSDFRSDASTMYVASFKSLGFKREAVTLAEIDGKGSLAPSTSKYPVPLMPDVYAKLLCPLDGTGGESEGGSAGQGDIAYGSFQDDMEKLEKKPRISSQFSASQPAANGVNSGTSNDGKSGKNKDDGKKRGGPGSLDSGSPVNAPAPPVIAPVDEKIIKSIEMENQSRVHKSVCIVLCKDCHYLEFPGCGQHKQLLSIRKPNGHAKCARCTSSTDNNGPWVHGCRQCKGATRKIFWSLSVREAQFLLRAFPSEKRKNKEDLINITVLACPSCKVVGFPGIAPDDYGDASDPLSQPKLALRTKDHEFDMGDGKGLDETILKSLLQHIRGCPNTGKDLEKISVNISFGEAKYLYQTINNVETMSSFRCRSGGLREGMQIAMCSAEGAVDAKESLILGTFDEDMSSSGWSNLSGKDKRQDGEGLICVSVKDENTGIAAPKFLKSTEAKLVTHTMG